MPQTPETSAREILAELQRHVARHDLAGLLEMVSPDLVPGLRHPGGPGGVTRRARWVRTPHD